MVLKCDSSYVSIFSNLDLKLQLSRAFWGFPQSCVAPQILSHVSILSRSRHLFRFTQQPLAQLQGVIQGHRTRLETLVLLDIHTAHTHTHTPHSMNRQQERSLLSLEWRRWVLMTPYLSERRSHNYPLSDMDLSLVLIVCPDAHLLREKSARA